jgi:hypothetical protein
MNHSIKVSDTTYNRLIVAQLKRETFDGTVSRLLDMMDSFKTIKDLSERHKEVRDWERQHKQSQS